MPVLTGQRAKEESRLDERIKYRHGALGPIEERYLRWRSKDEKAKGVTKPEEVEYEVWLKLPRSQQGSEVVFHIDPRVIAPELEYQYDPKITRGFDQWTKWVYPSIKAVIGKGSESLSEFADRAASGKWFIEFIAQPTGEMFVSQNSGKQVEKTVPVFTRMTQSLDELAQWADERYPHQKEEEAAVVVPDEVLSVARVTLKHVAGGDKAKFASLATQSDILAPFRDQLVDMVTRGTL